MSGTTEQQLAELRRANEILQRERDAARTELRRCSQPATAAGVATITAENEELRAAQAAGLEVLQAMVASPGDTQPVFDLIAQQAAKLCDVPIAMVGIFDGSMVHLVTQSGFDDAYTQLFASQFPRAASTDFAMGRAILSGRIEQIEDTGTAERNGFKPPPGPGSALAVPLMRNGATLGVIAVGRRVTGPFPRNQITLLRTFAEQAVIAITSSETYRALAQRNSEYGERIEHQSATIDVLKAMSASPGDPQPVFDLIVQHAQAQCNSANAALYEYDGMIHCRSIVSNVLSNEGLEAYVNRFPMPLEQEPDNGVSVSIRSGRVVHIRDANAEGGMSAWARSQGVQSGIAVPMVRAGRALGCIVLTELRPGGYSESQVELLKTFAEQAVIAISSAETYRALAQRNSEYDERIEHQAATIEVLRAMSASPGDDQPVLDLIVRHARSLCNAGASALAAYDGRLVRIRAYFDLEVGANPQAVSTYLELFPLEPTRGSLTCRAILDRQIIHIQGPMSPTSCRRSERLAIGHKSPCRFCTKVRQLARWSSQTRSRAGLVIARLN